jgi:hypothetical protein
MPVSARSSTCLLLAASLLLAACTTVRSQPAGPDSADPVEAYLVRLGLVDHAIEYLEGELAKNPKREALARGLADHYANRLLDAGNPAELDQFQGKIADLLAKHPGLRTPQLDTIVLQGDFLRGEKDFGHWVFNPEDTQTRDRAAEIFARIGPALRANAATLDTARLKLESEAEKTPDGPARDARFRIAQRAAQHFGRAAFFAAWSHYYLAQLKHLDPSDETLRQASVLFRKLVPVEDAPRDADLEDLDLGSPLRARAALGLALVDIATGKLEAGTAWFQVLAGNQVHPEVRDAVSFWYLFALIRAGKTEDALAFAKSQASPAQSSPPGQLPWFKLLIVQAGSQKGPWLPLGESGLLGLIRAGHADTARALVAKYQLPVSADSWPGQLLTAMSRLDAAEKSAAAADYRRAAEAFLAAREPADKNSPPWAKAGYQAAYCLIKAGDWTAAMRLLETSLQPIRDTLPELGGDATWLLALSYENLMGKDPSLRSKWMETLKLFTREYPKHSQAKKAQASLTGAMAAPLPGTKTETTRGSARDQLKQDYLAWRSLRADPAKASEALQKVRTAARTMVEQQANEANKITRLEAALMLADTHLSASPPEPARAAEVLKQGEAAARELPAENRLASDYQVMRLHLAQATGDIPMASAASAWLATHRKGTPLHESALVGVAKTADARLASAGDSTAVLAAASQAYESLVRFLGETPESLRNNRNARIATFRLAELQYSQGRIDDCRALLEQRLLKAFPRETKYLRLMGLACNEGRATDQALECWRLLTTGLTPESPEWYEAKYHHMANLSLKSIGDARLAFSQFKVLHPDMGPEPHRALFLQLEKKLAQ